MTRDDVLLNRKGCEKRESDLITTVIHAFVWLTLGSYSAAFLNMLEIPMKITIASYFHPSITQNVRRREL